MASDWQYSKLGDLVEIKHGFAFKSSNFSDEPTSDILLTPGNFAIGGGFKYDKLKYFDGDVPEEFVLTIGDLLVTMTDLSKQADTLGYPAIVPETPNVRYLHNQRLGLVEIRPDAPLHKRYLFYLLCSREYRHEVIASATGTTVKHTAPKRIAAFKFLLPTHDDQRAIAHILGSLDDKIELNRRMNKTLEAMARAIFKSWFIDFDPVIDNALLARNPIPEKFVERAETRLKILDQNQPSPHAPLPKGEGSGNYRGGYDFSGLVNKARELRKKQTPAEAVLWKLLRNRQFMNLKFRRQHQIGDYIADFYCNEYRLVIELDGGLHHQKQGKDHKRDAWLQSKGYTVLRFPNEQLFDYPETVLSIISEAVLPSPDGRGGGEGMADIRHLFPDSFQDSELGEIPKGWEIKSLDDIADYLNGLACQKYPPEEGKESLPVIKIRELRQGITANTDRATTAIPDNYIVEDGDVLFSWSGSLLIDIWTQGRGVLNQHLFKVTSNYYPKWFYYYWTEHHLFEFQQIAACKATTMGHIKRHHLSDAKVHVPNNKVIQIADEHINPLFEKTIQNELEVQKLTSLRDTLLPKLISGELVPDAEKLRGDIA